MVKVEVENSRFSVRGKRRIVTVGVVRAIEKKDGTGKVTKAAATKKYSRGVGCDDEKERSMSGWRRGREVEVVRAHKLSKAILKSTLKLSTTKILAGFLRPPAEAGIARPLQ